MQINLQIINVPTKKKFFTMIEFYECICEEKNAAFWKKIIDDLSKFF